LQASSYNIELWASLDKLRMSGNIVLKRTPKLELPRLDQQRAVTKCNQHPFA